MVVVFLFIFGAVFGSFAMCQVWRMRDWQTKRKKTDWRHDHSHCLHCGYRLQWFDNIPVFSWIWLRGKCRKCGKPIGFFEIFCEVGLGTVFVLSYVFWPLEIIDFRSAAAFFVFLAACVGLLMLFVYDMKWRRLPEKPLIFCIVCAVAFVILRDWGMFSAARLFDILGGLMILPGLYFVLYKASGERLVGSGDYLLAIPLALFADGLLPAFFVLFVSNLLGSVVMLPVVFSRKRNKMSVQISFGPFLIVGFFIVFFLQNYISALMAI